MTAEAVGTRSGSARSAPARVVAIGLVAFFALVAATPASATAAAARSTTGSRRFEDAATGPALGRDAAATGPCVDLLTPADVAWLDARYPGHDVTVAVHDERTGCGYEMHPERRITTASVFKIAMTAEVLLRAQDAGRPLTAHEDALIWPMISRSDDAATTQLLIEAGGPAAMNALYARLGMTGTTTTGWKWGLETSTSARDQVELMRLLVGDRPGTFSAYSRAAAAHYFGTVVPSQRWGVGAGLPAGWSALNKNGFYPTACCAWRINTVGRVQGPGGAGYDVAILSHRWATDAEGIAAVEYVARVINGRLARAFDSGALPSVGPVAVNADGRFEAFGLAAGGTLFNVFQLAVGQGWTGWYPHPGAWPSDRPVGVSRNLDGRLDLFAVLADGRVQRTTQNPVAGGWTPATTLPGALVSPPAVARNLDGRLEVFGIGTDGQLWHTAQITPGGPMGGWASFGGSFAGAPAVGTTPDGRLIVGAVTGAGTLLAAAQTTPAGAWTGLVPLLSGAVDRPAFARQADGRLSVVVRGIDGRLLHAAQAGFGWSVPVVLSDAVVTRPPALATNADGRLSVFAVDDQGHLLHQFQLQRNGTGWSAAHPLGDGLTGPPTVAANADGRLEVFARSAAGDLRHSFQTTPSGIFSPVYSLGGVLVAA